MILLEVGHLALLAAVLGLAAAGWVLVAWTPARTRQTREVAEAARGFELLVERSADPVIIIDGIGTMTYVNPSAMEVFGYHDDRIGTSALSILHPDEAEATAARIGAAVAGDPLRGTTLRRIRAGDGRWITCESVGTNLLAEPSVAGIVVVLRDVSDRIAAAEAAAAEHAVTQAILDTTTALVVTTTLDGHLISLNRAAEELTGYRTSEVMGDHWSRFVPADERPGVDEVLSELAGGQLPTGHENHWTSRTGARRLIAWNNAVLPGADGIPMTIIATGIDVTEARRAEIGVRRAEQRERDRLAWDATHDALTGLVNRAGLLDHLDRLLADPEAQPIAILFVDLDDFKAINDEHGHSAGDQVLQIVSRRLVDSVRIGDMVGRLGGDEFVVLCPNLDQVRADVTARRIDASVADPILIDGLTLRTGASTGTVMTIGGQAANLLEQADLAMYTVKRGRQGTRGSSSASGGAPMHPEEEARLAALGRLDLLDTGADPFVDTIVRLAAQVCGTPIAAVSLIDVDRQWFKSSIGLDATETPRSAAFCAHTILDPDHAFVVDDVSGDRRFEDNPLVTGDPHIRFYAGAPIAVGGQPPIGSLCVIDDVPRRLTGTQLNSLERLRDSLVIYLELSDHQPVVARRPGGVAS